MSGHGRGDAGAAIHLVGQVFADETRILTSVLQDDLFQAVEFLPLDEVVELHAQRRLAFDRHERIEGAARLPYANVLQDDAIEGKGAAHPLRRPVQDRARVFRRDHDVDAVQDARVEHTRHGRRHALLPRIRCLRDRSPGVKSGSQPGPHRHERDRRGGSQPVGRAGVHDVPEHSTV